MLHRRITLSALLFLLFLTTAAFAADLNYPYARFSLRLPPSEDPFPGLGTYYSTLSLGMKTVLWNPASLGKLKLSEASLSLISAPGSYDYERVSKLSEEGGEFDLKEGSGTSGGKYGIFYRYPQDIGPGLVTREIEVMSHSNYAAAGAGINFASALKVNDWLSVGFAANSPIAAEINMAGDFPVTSKATMDMRGQTIDQTEITADGKLKFTYTNGVVVTYESTAAVWGGFLSQEAVLPVIAYSEFRNDMNIHSPYTGSIATKYNNFYFGLNMIPINASANINNDGRAIVSSDTQDIYLYYPNFDPDNQTDINDWVNDPARYGSSEGYLRREVHLPAGEVVGTAKYRGFYSASTARFDLGAMYDVTDWFTVGLVFENLTGSSLNFKGNGIATFANYRDVNTSEVENIGNLLEPGGKQSVDIISEQWVTTFEAGESKFYLEPEKTYDLPRRLRYGFALKRPFLITVDFEQNSTPIKFLKTENDAPKEITVSNISLLRIGMETQFFALPLWLRSGLTLIAKPSVTGLDADAQKNLDDAFRFGYLPLNFDLGGNINAWGTIVGTALGVNGQSVLNAAQFDSTNMNLSKLVYGNLYVGKDAWLVNYLFQVDPAATAAAYGAKTVPSGEEKKFEASDLRFVQTLGVTYRF